MRPGRIARIRAADGNGLAVEVDVPAALTRVRAGGDDNLVAVGAGVDGGLDRGVLAGHMPLDGDRGGRRQTDR